MTFKNHYFEITADPEVPPSVPLFWLNFEAPESEVPWQISNMLLISLTEITIISPSFLKMIKNLLLMYRLKSPSAKVRVCARKSDYGLLWTFVN